MEEEKSFGDKDAVAKTDPQNEEAPERTEVVEEAVPAEGAKQAKKPRKKWTKKKKITVWSIVAAVLVVAIIVSSVTVKFVMFNDEVYEVDLEKVKAGDTVFVDDFDTLDKNVWLVDLNWDKNGNPSFRRGGYWTEDAVTARDGNLVITTKKDAETGRWTTGAVSSLGTKGYEDENGNLGFSKKYGYYETRCKLPKGYGIWSAFWFMPTNGLFNEDTPNRDASLYGAEIDVFEVPIWPNNRVQQAVHVGGYEKNHASTFNPRWLTFDNPGDLYDTYHTYGLYWNEDIYKFYIDGKCVWTTSYGNNVAKVEEYMIFSVEIGGENGSPTLNPWKWIGGKLITANKEGDYYQSEFLIDYVKVWEV